MATITSTNATSATLAGNDLSGVITLITTNIIPPIVSATVTYAVAKPVAIPVFLTPTSFPQGFVEGSFQAWYVSNYSTTGFTVVLQSSNALNQIGTYTVAYLVANSSSFSGLVSADSLYATNTIIGATVTAAGLITADSFYAIRDIKSSTLTTTGLVSADSLYTYNTIMSGTLVTADSLYAIKDIVATRTIRGDSLYTYNTIMSGTLVTADSLYAIRNVVGSTLTTSGLVSGDSVYAKQQMIADSFIATNSVVAKNIFGVLPVAGRQAMFNSSAAISNSETLIIADSFIPNRLQAGTTLRVWAVGVKNSTTTAGDSFKVRIGPSAIGGPPVAWVTCANSNPGASGNAPFWFESVITIRTAGSGATFYGVANVRADTTYFAGIKFVKTATTNLGTINTTVANLVQLTYNSNISTSSNTFYEAGIEVVRP
jgi:hypothetical protein